MRILGIDPGLVKSGWGVIDFENNRLKYVASGLVKSVQTLPMEKRIKQISDGLASVIATHKPNCCSLEKTFLNVNPVASLMLGQARGAIMLTVAQASLELHEYEPNKIKKTVVGAGKADKKQVQLMIKQLLPMADFKNHDEADALAVAICHSSYVNIMAQV